jgi:hypothetical protein
MQRARVGDIGHIGSASAEEIFDTHAGAGPLLVLWLIAFGARSLAHGAQAPERTKAQESAAVRTPDATTPTTRA